MDNFKVEVLELLGELANQAHGGQEKEEEEK